MALTEREQMVIDCIRAVRAEHHACTAAEVASRLGISKAYMSEVMQSMADKGLVAWSPDMVGSLRVIDDEPDVESAQPVVCGTCGWPDDKALAGHINAKHKVKPGA